MAFLTVPRVLATVLSALALVGCDQAPLDENASAAGGEQVAAPPVAATSALAPPVSIQPESPERRIAALEAEVAGLKTLLQKFSVDAAGNVTFTGNLQVVGAMGINTAAVAGQGLTVVGTAIGVKSTAETAIVARGSTVGVDTDGAENGILATSANVGVASSGHAYSFYGFRGYLHNDVQVLRNGDAELAP